MHSVVPESRLHIVSKLLCSLGVCPLILVRRQEDMSGWLLTDNAASWQGTPSDRGWRYLHLALKRYDNQSNDFRYAKASLETILSAGRSLSPPLWLIDILEVGSRVLLHCKAELTCLIAIPTRVSNPNQLAIREYRRRSQLHLRFGSQGEDHSHDLTFYL